MYQPAHGRFIVADPAALLDELSAVVPATLVTVGPEGMRTTILPMLFDPADGEHGTLRGHVARGNPHWREIADDGMTEAIAIFNGPDAYISPAWYEEKRLTGKVVPTWNYTTVVAHGRLTLHHEPDWLIPARPAARRAPRGGPGRTVERRRRAGRLRRAAGEGDRRARAADRADRCQAQAHPEPERGRLRRRRRGTLRRFATRSGRRDRDAPRASRAARRGPPGA